MPKSKKSSCASCETCATRKTSAARTAKAAESGKPAAVKSAKLTETVKSAETGKPAKGAESGKETKAAKGAVKTEETAKEGGSAEVGKLAKAARRPKKSEVPPERLCEFCDAKCCRYFALPIDKPSTFEEFDYVRWYLLHERASVFVEDGDWFLLVHTPCKELGPDNRCQIYETRPQICREYSTTRCEYDDLFVFEQYFETPEQVEEYAVATLGPRPGTTPTAAKSAKSIKSAAKKTVKKETKTAKTTKGRASTKKSTRRGA
ncbi:MAG: YkgJ family cysteine cluster protein [Thermoguttaceae bacterium]|nr:YkgJ family cysteine cluster protein [Thermoguttaceae bacterium]